MGTKRLSQRLIHFGLFLIFVTALTIGYGTPAPAQPVIKLTLSHNMPTPPHVSGQAFLNWAQRIEQQSNGRVKIVIYPAATLVAPKDQYDALAGGVADMGSLGMYYNPQQFPLGSIITAVAGLSFSNVQARNRVFQELLTKFPEIQVELKGVKVLFMYTLPPNSLQFVKRIAAHSPADIKGMRIAAPAGFFPILRAWGAVEVDIPFTERYMALDKGTIDGSSVPMGPVQGARLYEVTKSTVMNTGALPQAASLVVMNEKTWNRLPPDIKKVFFDNNEYGMLEIDKAILVEEQQGIDSSKRVGHTIVTATPEEYQLWTKPLLPLQERWVAEREAKGKPARAVFEETKRLLAKYGK
jgi:TRAP-type transport system periplasmic protein